MGKKTRVSLFESYASSLNPNNDYDYNPPLPDSMRTSTLLEQIGKERSWTDDQVDEDVAILEKNRLYFVRDLRVLSDNSWSMIEIIPLLRDLLRQAIDPNWAKQQQAMHSSANSLASKMEYKSEKKKKRKDKKEKKKRLDEPVMLSGRDELAMAESNIMLAPPELMKDVLSEDPETIRNTIRNGSIDVEKDEEEHSGYAIGDDCHQKKSVSFSSQNGGTPYQSTPTLVNSSADNSSSFSSSPSSCSSSDDDMITRKQQKSASNDASSFGVRPIKPVGPNRMQVKTASGQIYECDRFCPHKGVDLTTWGQVLGNTLVCTKHNWRFGLDGNGMGNKGRSVHPCKVNDW